MALDVQLYHGDCLTELEQVPDESVNLCFVDPPYNIGVFCKMPPDEYLAWCEKWVALCSRKLTANGAFWVSHSEPDVLLGISQIVKRYRRERVSWITWDKWNGGLLDKSLRSESWGAYWKMVNNPGIRCFPKAAEYLIYHADEGQWTAQCDKERGFIFEPLRAYLDSEWKRAGLNFEDARHAVGCASGSGLPSHWFTRSQWILPTKERYSQLCTYANNHNHDGKYLRREYEDLRREYESLRYTFNNPGKVSSVWQIPPAKRNGHLTPKPEALLERIILATSNEGDTVLDPMMGSGTTGKMAVLLKRSFIGCEIKSSYFKMAQRRIEQAQIEAQQLNLPGLR